MPDYLWTLAKWAGRDVPANVDDLIWEANDIIGAYAESNPEYGEPELRRLSDSMWECYCELGIVGEKEELFKDT